MKIHHICIGLFFLALQACVTPAEENQKETGQTNAQAKTEVLPSWNQGPNKEAIISYVESVTDKSHPDFIPPSERIATFDNDGTLWSEQPIYFQFYFALDRIKAMAPEHPDWKDLQPYKAVLENDRDALSKLGKEDILEIIVTTHAGMTTDEFEDYVTSWVATAKHPTKNKPFTELVYQPMRELMDYLRANDFKVFIVSGGGIEFMRPWTEEVYGIPRNQVVGSSVRTEYDYNEGDPVIKRLGEIDFIDDKEGKPLGINRHIGRRPVFAAGNSDGDLQMLRWTDSNDRKSFKLYVHHTDSVREWAYDRDSHVGRFDKGLDEAKEKGWTLVNMKEDWKVVYPFEKD